jgi:hypothetical protein
MMHMLLSLQSQESAMVAAGAAQVDYILQGQFELLLNITLSLWRCACASCSL